MSPRSSSVSGWRVSSTALPRAHPGVLPGWTLSKAASTPTAPRAFLATDLMGSPPCRPYSAAGEGAGRRALDAVLHVAAQVAARRVIQWVWPRGDGRTGLVLLLEPLRWTLQVLGAGRPCRTVMLEQVRAEEYGVPQARAGAVLVARRGDQAALPRTGPLRAQRRSTPG